MIVATAGHIDHGKTSLLRALTGVDCDRLPEEKARGISIDLGFAYWRCATGDLIGFVDVPGHEKFIRNMLAGVCGIDFALLVVAADDGVMPQTIEHVQVLDLLAIPRGAVVVTKADLVSQEHLARVQDAVRSLLADTTLAGAPVLSASSVTGAGLEALKACLTDAARHQRERAVEGRLFRLAVDRAFTVAGSGTVVTGTVFSGEAHVGDRLQVAPAGPAARVRGIRIHQEAVTRVQAGQRCAINLAGPTREQVSRGDWLLHEELQAPTQRIDVRLRVSDSTEAAVAHWSRVQLHLGTSAVMARVAITRGESIEPGAERRVQLVLEQPAIALHGDRFVVRDAAARRTVGGGVVLDPFAPATRRLAPARLAWL
ncbi:MAG TPA: selenocysteine-specific translation elongation factor, partial [Ramlibacter sp.]|nr:selenocysteine-specific translation elongation factor [Ramlibacter sp.]